MGKIGATWQRCVGRAKASRESTKASVKNADPFFWLVLLAVAPAAVVAWEAERHAPTWALRSEAV